MFISINITTILGVGVVIIRYKLGLSCAKLSSSWLVQSSLAELRFALYLIITTPTHPHPPRIVVIAIEINIERLLAVVRV